MAASFSALPNFTERAGGPLQSASGYIICVGRPAIPPAASKKQGKLSVLSAIVKRISWRISGRVASDILAFVFYATLARVFGESQMGDYASAFALAHLFAFGIELGLRPLLTREVARNVQLASKYLGNILVTQLLLTVAIGALLYWSVTFLSIFGENRVLLLIAFMAIAMQSIGLSFVACLEAIEEMTKVAVIEVTERAVVVLVGTSLILTNASLQVVMIAYVIAGIAYCSLAFYWYQKSIGRISIELDFRLIKNVVVASLPFLGASALNVLYSRVDVLMLYSFVGKAETGAYSIAYRCVESSLIVALMVGLTIYPALSRSPDPSLSKSNPLFSVTLKWLGIYGVLGAVLLVTIGDALLLLIFGTEYEHSAEIVRYMAVLFLLGCIKVPYWRLLFAMNREMVQLTFQVISILANIALNLVLIPRYGALGAIVASTVSEVFLVAAFHFYCRKLQKTPRLGSVLALGSCACIAIAAGLGTRDLIAWPFVGVLTLVIFIAVILSFGLVSRKEQALIFSTLRDFLRRCLRLVLPRA